MNSCAHRDCRLLSSSFSMNISMVIAWPPRLLGPLRRLIGGAWNAGRFVGGAEKGRTCLPAVMFMQHAWQDMACPQIQCGRMCGDASKQLKQAIGSRTSRLRFSLHNSLHQRSWRHTADRQTAQGSAPRTWFAAPSTFTRPPRPSGPCRSTEP